MSRQMENGLKKRWTLILVIEVNCFCVMLVRSVFKKSITVKDH